eukprot:CAMPEP_0197685540 /NCGR_PEP_ID=MMETSP1338-20131121/101086_1 /TAXON_ID=43686 ORGANISM="Pelagodinium beii, Strain RCC1491" /NCGR_SAMPLE_ID=MMETSP1338 /ASSEMBLY_ACC=CAM_ASM_000754 /LENGTH=229 /DNA_ID=CAMNT_0043267375 /DNA_START=39 /DNA_END=725 /DNA_ORIENTATION=-
MNARGYNQRAYGDSFQKQPVGSTFQLLLEAFPEIGDFQHFVSRKVSEFSGEATETESEVPPQLVVNYSLSNAVSEFCKKHPATRIEPTVDELEMMADDCFKYHPSVAAQAVADQLTGWTDPDFDWRPKLRALHLLEYLACESGWPGEASRTVIEDSSELLQYLHTEVPQCKSIAQRLLEGDAKEADRPRILSQGSWSPCTASGSSSSGPRSFSDFSDWSPSVKDVEASD